MCLRTVSKSEANSPSAWYLNLTSTSPDGIGTRFSEKFHVIWNSPGCWDQLESLRDHEEIGVKSPLDSADLISRKRVPFIGSGVLPAPAERRSIDVDVLIDA